MIRATAHSPRKALTTIFRPMDYEDELRARLADRYRLGGELGRGGMATVFLADDVKHRREVAVKVLRPDLAATLGVERFLREIEIAAGLNHPNILPLLDSGDLDGILFYVMPYVDGESLRGLLVRDRTTELDFVQRIASEVADALGYAHRRGVLHRDIKPENILLSEGHAVVADFGIAKAISTAGGANLTRTGFPLGTPGYMSPEQAAGSTALDERTDVYSLATVIYEMLVGETPGFWPSDEAVRLGRFTDAPESHRRSLDRAPSTVEQALTKAMAMRPGQRFATPGEFAAALTRPSTGRRYSEAEVSDIVLRAAQADTQATESGALSLGGIQQIGAEVGIPPDKIAAAARLELAASPPSALPSGIMGAASRIDLDVHIDGEVPEDEFGTILEDIRGTMGEVGRLNATLGRSLSWNSLSFQNSVEGSGRLMHVMVNPKDGRTRIRITEGSGMHVPVLLGSIGLGTVIAAGFASGLGDVASIVVGGAFAVTSYLGLRVGFRSFIRRRRRILTNLMSRIASRVVTPDRALSPEPAPDAPDPINVTPTAPGPG